MVNERKKRIIKIICIYNKYKKSKSVRLSESKQKLYKAELSDK